MEEKALHGMQLILLPGLIVVLQPHRGCIVKRQMSTVILHAVTLMGNYLQIEITFFYFHIKENLPGLHM